jgi:SpoVK/Ycf46/Vps4 family AAA+-type ATPase
MDNFIAYLDKQKQATAFDATQFMYITNMHYMHNNLGEPKYTGLYEAWQKQYSADICLPPLEPIYKTIDISANTISDLIAVIDANPYEVGIKYNFDLKALHNIRSELVELNAMIGMNTLKSSVFNQLIYFIQDLHIDAKNKTSDFKHTIICGPPGTGKTEVATIIGRMYSKVGILKKDVFKKVTRSDLIAGYLGQTAIKTTKVITDCLGGCLFIDEAYALANKTDTDIYSKECIDTICEALSNHKDDLMVIIAGYEDELEETFFKANCGLKSRFIWKFKIEDYSADEMKRIFDKKVTQQNWSVDCETAQWFESKMDTFKYFGRDVELLLSYVKICHSRRVFGKDESCKKKITMDDINAGYKVFLENKNSKPKEVAASLYGFYL